MDLPSGVKWLENWGADYLDKVRCGSILYYARVLTMGADLRIASYGRIRGDGPEDGSKDIRDDADIHSAGDAPAVRQRQCKRKHGSTRNLVVDKRSLSTRFLT